MARLANIHIGGNQPFHFDSAICRVGPPGVSTCWLSARRRPIAFNAPRTI
jgi:hypothetical protein